jgi:hypothetical protein
MVVGAHLYYMRFWNKTDSGGYEYLREITEPVTDYSLLQNETGTYRYIWQVVVDTANPIAIPPLYCLIDASNGEIIPTVIIS